MLQAAGPSRWHMPTSTEELAPGEDRAFTLPRHGHRTKCTSHRDERETQTGSSSFMRSWQGRHKFHHIRRRIVMCTRERERACSEMPRPSPGHEQGCVSGHVHSHERVVGPWQGCVHEPPKGSPWGPHPTGDSGDTATTKHKAAVHQRGHSTTKNLNAHSGPQRHNVPHPFMRGCAACSLQ